MPTYSVIITDDEDRVLRSWVEDPQAWLEHAFRNKIRQRLNATVAGLTNLNPQKITDPEKFTAIEGLTLPTPTERNETLT